VPRNRAHEFQSRNALSAELFPASVASNIIDADDNFGGVARVWSQTDLSTREPGQVGGIVVDTSGAVIPNVEITVTNTQTGASLTTTSDAEGHWRIAGMQPGAVKVNVSARGFKRTVYYLDLQASKPAHIGTTLEAARVSETVNIVTDGAENNTRLLEEWAKKKQAPQLNALSPNVFNLQRRVAGILPVAVEVPRSGKSYRFVRPLVWEEETRITFQYKSK